MRMGKLSNERLQKLVLDKLTHFRNEVLFAPQIGFDCAALDLADNLCVISSDPITATSSQLGRLAVHVNCNDVAASGAEPVAMMVTLLLPLDTTEAFIENLMEEMVEAARTIQVEIVGGHTEITNAVNRPVVSACILAKAPKDGLVTAGGLRPGMDIVMTKWAGLEGSSILVGDFPEEAGRVLNEEEMQRVRDWDQLISVVKDSKLALANGAKAMHDVTEGGIFGALWEMATASACGLEIESRKIILREETKKLCDIWGMNPYKLIGSGCLLIACEDGAKMQKLFEEAGLMAALIGQATDGAICCDGKPIEAPEADELMRIL